MSFDLDFFKRYFTVHLALRDLNNFSFVQFPREEESFHWKMVPGKVSPGKGASSGSVPIIVSKEALQEEVCSADMEHMHWDR